MREALLRHLNDHPWRDLVTVLDTVDSTNTCAKRLAREGAPHGTVVLADRQTGGRGRMGRRFSSPAGMGIYCSVVLRPQASPEELLPLTAVMAEAARRSVEVCTQCRPAVKWVNDLVLEGKKLCGILTEPELSGGNVEFVVVGVGINCHQKREDFPEELRDTAVSLSMITGKPADRGALAAELIKQISMAAKDLPHKTAPWMDSYRSHCITLGKEVQLLRGDCVRTAYAEGIDYTGALLVRLPDGTREAVSSGEVSVRGLYGYL